MSQERGATGGDQGVADRPNPEVVALSKCRNYTAEYEQRILAEADKAKEASGGIGAQHRREPAPLRLGAPVHFRMNGSVLDPPRPIARRTSCTTSNVLSSRPWSTPRTHQ